MTKRHLERTRLVIVLVIIALALGTISWRIFDLSYNRHAWYTQAAQDQIDGSNVLVRGNIYLKDGDQDFLVAVNQKMPTLVLTPSLMDQQQLTNVAATLASITGLDPQSILKVAMSGISGSRVVANRLTNTQASQITALKAAGVAVGAETDRDYPAGMLAANVIGFLGYDQTGQHGQYGIEAQYESALSGTPSSPVEDDQFNPLTELKSLFGKGVPTPDPTQDAPKDVILTLDKNIQTYIEATLAAVLHKYKAASGVVIVQEPNSGEILGMAVSPSFDPNNYSSFPEQNYVNSAVQIAFEPGSSFKPITMSAGLDLSKVTPDSTFDDNKNVVEDGYTINNFNDGHFGVVTMTQILEKSINTGAMYVQSLLTHDQFLNYIINEGYGQQTGIDLPDEASGDISNLYTGRAINFMTASFGQGITATPIQLINSYSAIANGGKLMRPYVVQAVRDAQGTEVVTQPQIIGTPFSAATSAQLRSMLVSVVDIGFDNAKIPHYDIAGKTGTAQIADPVNGGYLPNQYNHSFVGFAPGGNPRFVILIKMEKPQGVTYASDTLSPVFKDIAAFLLNYFNVPPTR